MRRPAPARCALTWARISSKVLHTPALARYREAGGGENEPLMRIHLINPSDVSFGAAVITPRWLYVLAAATPAELGDPQVIDETLEQIDMETVKAGDVIGIGIHTLNALRGYEVGRAARDRGAYVVYGGIHSTLFPEEPFEYGGAHAVVKGDGDRMWPIVIIDCKLGTPQRVYDGGKI